MAGQHVDPAVRDLSRRLLSEAEVLAPEMADRIRAEIEVYRDGGAVSAPALNASCSENLKYVLGNLAGTPLAGGETPRATGVARAEAGVPYAAVLHAYRIGGRFIWELLVSRADADARDTLLRAAADIWAVTDELSAQVTDAYRTTLADRVRHDAQIRSALLATLLDGDTSTAEQLWDSASVLKLARQGHFVIVSAECPTPGIEALPDVEELLNRRDVTSAWRLDHQHQDGLVTLRARFDLNHLVTLLGEIRVQRVGISSTFAHVDHAHRALREARLACAAATPASSELVHFEDHPTAVLLATMPDATESFVRRVLGPILDLAPDDRRVLVGTARVWLAEDGSTSSAAQVLHLHRNTVRYRLRHFEELTGHSLTRPIDIADVHLALEGARILGL